jgi:hypothetical protein
MQRFLVPVFTFIWWKRLFYETENNHRRLHIVKVKGWRTVLVDRSGYGRETVSFCFWWFK